MTSAAITEGMLRAFTKYGMDKGYAFVLLGSHQFNVSLYPTGVLSLALAGSEGAKFPVEVDFWYLLYALTSRPLDQWTIVNTVQGTKYTVGIFDKNNLTISPLLYFPRGLTSPPQNEPFLLNINLNNWIENQTFNYQRATKLVFQNFKLSTKNYEIFAFTMPPCAIYSEVDGYLGCYIAAKTNQISVLLSSEFSAVAVYQNIFMRYSGLLLPFSSCGCISSYLTSTEEYPNFIRILQDETIINPHVGLILKKLRYKKFNVFFDLAIGEELFTNVLSLFNKLGIEIVTPPELQVVNRTDPEYFDKAAQFVKDSELRPMMVTIINEDFLSYLAAFEKVGLKAEDMVVLDQMSAFYDKVGEFTAVGQTQLDLYYEYARSMVIYNFRTYADEVGKQIEDKIAKAFGLAVSTDCYGYDNALHAVKAFDFMLKRGLDFYDWRDMISALRAIRFKGCSGAIQFTEDDNNRSNIDFDFSQAREIDGKYTEVKVLRTSISGQSYFKYNDFEWFDDTSNTPKESRLNEVDCPFPEEYRQDSDQSIDLTIALNWAVVGLCVIMNVATYFIYVRGSPFLDNEEAITLSTQDNIVLASTLIEPLVFDLVSPGINVYALIMSKSIDSRLDWSDGKYFNLLNWIYALAGAALVTTGICAFNKFKPLVIDLQLLAAFIVRSLFFVLAFILLSTLDCNESQTAGDLELSDAFMDIDCYQQCWTGDHKKYAITSVVVLAGLVVLCSTLSSRLTNSLEGLQVYVNPTTELVRKSFLLIVIALYKSRPRLSTAAHYALYLGTLAVYSAVCIKLRVLSIPLLSSYFNLLLLLLLLMNLCEVLASEVYSNTVMWICLGGGLGLTLVGLALVKMRKFAKLLIPAPKINTEVLFIFAFRRNQIFPANRFVPVASSPSQRENRYLAS
jgi:hypothetical protein